MNLTLKRTEQRLDGIFGRLEDELGHLVAVTLEHSYDCRPKLPAGTYTCRRGMHRLGSMTQDFETFEITGVPGHTGILFHVGNRNEDSAGCVLVGDSLAGPAIARSRVAFARLMALQQGVDQFTLTVV